MKKTISLMATVSLLLTGCQTLSPNTQPNGANQTEAEEVVDNELTDSPVDHVPLVIKAQKAPQTAEVIPDIPEEPLPPADIWERIRAGYQLKLDHDQPRLYSQIKWYSSHPAYLDRVSNRGQRYLHYIVSELEKNNMPLEIAFLPIVESGFDPFGYSHGRASGPWQFIPSTGQIYGLDQTWWFDGRRDIVLSTQAAISYLKRLHGMFDGNWLHALASYNSGEGTVMRAIRRNKQAGKPTDFWSLDLPAETRAYVPKLLALATIFQEPQKYNYQPVFVANEPYFEEVNIGGQMDLAQAAQMADISVDEIYLLNPAFNQWATSPDGPHRLLIPIDKAEAFRTKLAQISPEERLTWVRYTVEAGDNLLLIAKKHNTTVAVLQDVNKISSSFIRVGQELMIPVAGNKMESYTLSSHQRLLAKQSNAPSSNRLKVNYTVESGDSLWSIAKRYNTDTKTLARWNSMGLGDPLMPGKKLVVWLKPEKGAAAPTSRTVLKRVVYTIRSGDSLAGVAQRFKVSVADIRDWNPDLAKKKYIQPGDKVTMMVNVTGG
ncbi:LysM peptidoglycan-binding domain-containing protein [Maribrevibacterium harenarium]|uniref:LysM peptidoglycan-binding domain-containing protein n=1 Tax=Maribrevibacterium harenarium TaxID=2589817 RepID=A0A501WPB1_9GAMM|nr:LysM peptidoglycan-binding domain-containing protein [Maribrevibacterium harenarium]TPE51279.1 LysM peptidoglycan-binding domain-containing protein [Maribrevibacterium harenarium]